MQGRQLCHALLCSASPPPPRPQHDPWLPAAAGCRCVAACHLATAPTPQGCQPGSPHAPLPYSMPDARQVGPSWAGAGSAGEGGVEVEGPAIGGTRQGGGSRAPPGGRGPPCSPCALFPRGSLRPQPPRHSSAAGPHGTARHGTARHGTGSRPHGVGSPLGRERCPRVLPPGAAPKCCPQVLPPGAAPRCCPRVLPPGAAPECCPQVLPPQTTPHPNPRRLAIILQQHSRDQWAEVQAARKRDGKSWLERLTQVGGVTVQRPP